MTRANKKASLCRHCYGKILYNRINGIWYHSLSGASRCSDDGWLTFAEPNR